MGSYKWVFCLYRTDRDIGSRQKSGHTGMQKGKAMKVLILSCSTGEGHNAAGTAVRQALIRRGHEAQMMDPMIFGGERTRHNVSQAYIDTVKYTPWFFRFIYWVGSEITNADRLSPVYWANSLLADRLDLYIKKNEFDAVVCSHLYPAEIVSYLKNKGRYDKPFISIGTDYTLIPFWEETSCDAFVIPHRDCEAQYISRGIPEEKLFPTGIPVRQGFYEALAITQEEARKELGLPTSGSIVLVMSGSMGYGNVVEAVRKMDSTLEADEFAVVICGTNKKLEEDLRKHFPKSPQIRIVGYSKKIALYMRASDLIFTKPGGITSTEAAFMELPIVHSAPIPGCEEANRDFFRGHGMSVTGATIEEQLEAGRELLRSPKKRHWIRNAQAYNVGRQSAEDVCRLLETMVSDPDRQRAVNLALLWRPGRARGEGAL